VRLVETSSNNPSSLWLENYHRALHSAVEHKLDVFILYLLSKPFASIESCDRQHGRSLLLTAAAKGHLETVHLLLERGADVKAPCLVYLGYKGRA
jgi:hypothetical protein